VAGTAGAEELPAGYDGMTTGVEAAGAEETGATEDSAVETTGGLTMGTDV
jgi:hypothetical protein